MTQGKKRRTHNVQQNRKRSLNADTRSKTEFKTNRQRLLKDKPLCHWCNSAQATTADHLIEVDRWPTDVPGVNGLDNLVAACRSCNSSRGARYGNLKRKSIYELAPTVNVNTKPVYATDCITMQDKKENTFFSATLPAPDAPSFISKTAQTSGLASELARTSPIKTDGFEAEPARAVHNYADIHKPRLETLCNREGFYFADAVKNWSKDFLEYDLMPWQYHVATGLLAHDANGDLLHRQGLLSVARQNGKSFLLASIVGFWATVMPKLRGKPQTIITTSHRLDTALELFNLVAPILEKEFGAILTWAVGRNEANMPDGTRWLVRAATPTSFHGLTADLVCIDELWAVSPDAVSVGLLPTMRTRKSPLLFMTSTAGDESSKEMQRWQEQGLRAIDEKKSSSLYYACYSPSSDIDPMTPEAWIKANPALGQTLTLEVIAAEAEQPNRNAFLRSSVNLWTASANGWLQPGVFDKLVTAEPMPKGGVLSIEQSQDEARYVGVRAAMNSQGQIQLAVEFVKDTLADCWQAVEAACADQTTRLLITPAFEMSLPTKFERRASMVGNRELQRWTVGARAAILEGKIRHDGSALLSQHVERAVAVKNQGAVTLSSLRSPGPIELARCLVFAIAMVSKPAIMGKPMIVSQRTAI
ncbi:HNHc domain containing protein [uncultured Caudovirales phage]|uniref:HNHc domain containing protein n=1 Tax=uncultured Caudovirales phage TaxID=2100421 RepID=A0A6J5SPS8_9CAUD|nr:HNHc domain containing protein [uncultured Caudovirales phage]CAB4217200.1 HNHc domain containing protein [uncultured Caudovirales phage]CAB5225777.1 HNHc domain containing protein [uncultured Caudovirales phage]